MSQACQRDDLPWEGRGASLDITGIRFSLYPMDSSYEKIILHSLSTINTSKVFNETDALSTVYRGRLKQVYDCMGALFIGARVPGVHMVLEGQASKGCPGDVDADSFLAEDDTPLNRPNLNIENFQVIGKLALYPLGTPSYIDIIAHVFRMAEKAGLKPRIIHYATRIEGNVFEVLDFLEDVSRYSQDNCSHYVLHFTISVESPSVVG
jgi:uncharacterized protein YqgV (UPF0045/DUF77 family)